MAIITKRFRTLDEQINLLKNDRNLKIKHINKATIHLRTKNYFDLINGFETILLVDKNDKTKGYIASGFNDFLRLYNFDRTLLKEILRCILQFETKLRSVIAYRFSEAYCNTTSTTMEYMNINNYDIPPISSLTSRNLYIYYNHLDFILFKTFTYRGASENYVDKQKRKYAYINRYQDPPFWVIIKTFMLNDLFLMLNYLKRNEMSLVLSDFGLSLSERDAFINSVEIIKDLRNICAHFQLVTRFRTSGSLPINNYLISNLNLRPKDHNQFRLPLLDTIKVLNQFTSTKKILRVVKIFSIKMIFMRKFKMLHRVLERMGEENILKWRI